MTTQRNTKRSKYHAAETRMELVLVNGIQSPQLVSLKNNHQTHQVQANSRRLNPYPHPQQVSPPSLLLQIHVQELQ
ncbi:hypothetical protein BCR33DRAFT_719728 [Rhizoclosmatium globosum]|uniref:Uncharacterized protein n=1 Tax=Rhizoclosmatium globosum TaxID=329046 RepID=A0A1Y2BZ37_9FUNG|nr:hypothetical protein BCR33DRAFT_719728 [Rhizoclosmatium globosum]|eukprot:ORY39907.1 hypothetical protein BCR33DRAFT_719728 [Rhizoclosmatium globosum]